MITNDQELHVAQQRILTFEKTLAEARRTYTTANYEAMAEGFLTEIERLQSEIRSYLSTVASPSEAA